ncbi:ankyrin repeat domain-containing protein [Paenibacillus sp. B2(2019)]|uniref:ankyrin repeat domain-containing protein n=1 Tax=Paenibacillus sp. B2(2019) TaxID=2607754 RepID=UPI0011F0EC44|nr:ankyrin repeat domain-containing protein [Paenibacillus sp. B2(2019)]KAA1187232.1 ankyrin repeat domain-containing protein [Paenibacillus sp. B2(2019)]
MAYTFDDLYEAVEEDEFKKVKKILQADPTLITGKDDYEFSVLHGAVMTENTKMVEFLLDQGADVNALNDEGITPIHIALYPDVVTCLLNRGAEINKKSSDGSTPLHTQIADGEERLDVVGMLLAKGADKSIKDNDGQTPLDIARARQEEEMIELLS